MTQSLFIGVDGGATKCIVRVEDQNGKLLGRELSGPASIRLSVSQAWDSIYSALHKILQPLDISLNNKAFNWHVGMGLAGSELVSAKQAFLAEAHPFKTLAVSSDAHTACLGAHAGKDGAIIIIGTGVVGFQVVANQVSKVGGWGFPHDDEGSGAWLGLQAVKLTLQALDGRLPSCTIANLVYAKFENSMQLFLAWVNQANSTAFAELAPLIVQQAEARDPLALKIMQEAALTIDGIAVALQKASQAKLPLSLIGGIAPFMQPFLSAKLREQIRPCQLTPDAGAIILARANYHD